MKKTALFVAACLILALPTAARHVPVADAHKVAVQFWNNHRPADAKPVTELQTRTFTGLDHLYVFTNGADGFVIVSADDCVQPVLAYAFDAPFPEVLHPALAYWLRGYDGQIADAIENGYVPSEGISMQWQQLTTPTPQPEPTLLTNVPVMLATRWDQGDPYNMYCPFDSNRYCRTVVGCVATAMAQIMKYWNYPAFGQDSHSYTYHGNTYSANFGSTTYHWQLMPTFLHEASLEYQRKSVGMLSYHCGVAVEMMYGCSSIGGSGAYSYMVIGAMRDFFKYSSDIRAAYRYSYYNNDSAWCALLDAELAAGQPIYYTGSDSTGGHAFVLDGSDTARRYHFNWGWSGYGNGFYSINNLAPGINYEASGGNATYTFNMHQDIILGIRPAATEVFDTVDYYDSVCGDTRYVYFRDYTLNAQNMDTLLHHLDTVFNYHLKVIAKKYIVLEPNGGTGEARNINYCPSSGIVLPECDYTKTNCRFVGWCHRRNGEGDTVQPGTHVMLNNNRRYYALWQDTTVSISDADASTLTLGPNPVVDILSLAVPDGGTAEVVVMDLLGRPVLRRTIIGGKGKISFRDLPAGPYIVQVSTADGVYNRRVIKR